MFRFARPMDAVLRRPDIIMSVIERRRHIIAASQHPDFAGVHESLVIGSRRPAGMFRDQLPFFTVGRRPDIVLWTLLIPEVIVLGAAQDPHFVLEDNCA